MNLSASAIETMRRGGGRLGFKLFQFQTKVLGFCFRFGNLVVCPG